MQKKDVKTPATYWKLTVIGEELIKVVSNPLPEEVILSSFKNNT